MRWRGVLVSGIRKSTRTSGWLKIARKFGKREFVNKGISNQLNERSNTAMRTPEERAKMAAQLKNLQSQGQSRDLQIEVIEQARHPDIFAVDYQGEIPNMTDDERNALSWLHGHTTDEGLVGTHHSEVATPPATETPTTDKVDTKDDAGESETE